jgi:hypothetical protein
MGRFADNIRPYVDAELAAAALDPERGFSHLERAHVLGQASTREHVRVHWRMLSWALRHRDSREFFGQLLRLAGAATKTFIGMVPTGNTGGSNVSAIQPMPIDPEPRGHHRTGARRRALATSGSEAREVSRTPCGHRVSRDLGILLAQLCDDLRILQPQEGVQRAFPRPWW